MTEKSKDRYIQLLEDRIDQLEEANDSLVERLNGTLKECTFLNDVRAVEFSRKNEMIEKIENLQAGNSALKTELEAKQLHINLLEEGQCQCKSKI